MTKQTLSVALPPTRRDAVVERLREDIINGTLRPGEAIKDAELANRFGFSITPVQEALTQLALEGLVEMPPNRPKRVASLTRRTALESLAVFRVLSLTGYEWGLPMLSEQHVNQLRAEHEAFTSALSRGDRRATVQFSRAFHDVIIHAGSNRQLRRMLAASIPWIERLLMLCFPQETSPWNKEQQAILAAIECGDLMGAREAFCVSIDYIRHTLESLPASFWSDETQ